MPAPMSGTTVNGPRSATTRLELDRAGGVGRGAERRRRRRRSRAGWRRPGRGPPSGLEASASTRSAATRTAMRPRPAGSRSATRRRRRSRSRARCPAGRRRRSAARTDGSTVAAAAGRGDGELRLAGRDLLGGHRFSLGVPTTRAASRGPCAPAVAWAKVVVVDGDVERGGGRVRQAEHVAGGEAASVSGSSGSSGSGR